MDNVLVEELARIFPKVDDVTIRYNINEAKRLANDDNDILRLTIDLLLDGPQNTNVTDDAYVGSIQIANADTVYIDNEIDYESMNHSVTPPAATKTQQQCGQPTVISPSTVGKHCGRHIETTNVHSLPKRTEIDTAVPTSVTVMDHKSEKYQRPDKEITTSTMSTPIMKRLENSRKKATSTYAWLPNTPNNTPVATTINQTIKSPVIRLVPETVPRSTRSYHKTGKDKQRESQTLKKHLTENNEAAKMPTNPWLPITPPEGCGSGADKKMFGQPVEHLKDYFENKTDTSPGVPQEVAFPNTSVTESHQINLGTKPHVDNETTQQHGIQTNATKVRRSSSPRTTTPSACVSNTTTAVTNYKKPEHRGTNKASEKSKHQRNSSPSTAHHSTYLTPIKTIRNDHRLGEPTHLEFPDTPTSNTPIARNNAINYSQNANRILSNRLAEATLGISNAELKQEHNLEIAGIALNEDYNEYLQPEILNTPILDTPKLSVLEVEDLPEPDIIQYEPALLERPHYLNPDNIYQRVREIFRTVQQETVDRLVDLDYDIDQIVDFLLQHPELLKPAASETVTTPVPSNKPVKTHLNYDNETVATPVPSKKSDKTPINYYKHFSERTSYRYGIQCFSLLKNDFKNLYVVDIRAAMKKFNHHYAATRKYIKDRLAQSAVCRSGKCPKCKDAIPCVPVFQKPVTYRRGSAFSEVLEADLAMEVEFVKQQEKLEEENRNLACAQEINEKQYEEEGQLIECGCCFGDYPFEEVVQCTDAHLFCLSCLRSYAKEVIFGSAISQAELVCMTSGCTQNFPYSQLMKVLTAEEIAKYQDRLQQECLIKVDLPNLVKCPFCDFKAIVPENERVFTCMKEECLKTSCKDCGEEWSSHVGLKCSEIEKKCQTNLRVSYEEKMTLAKIRVCGRCSCQFTKSEGCNKMTCRCGQSMCYICRKAHIHYDHFCRHPREPGKKCATCTACSLWTNAAEDDELVVKELEREAKTAKRKLEHELGSGEKRQKI